MTTLEPNPLTDVELSVMREVLEAAYRRQDREAWEVQVSGADHHRGRAKERLEILAGLLVKFGSSPETALPAPRGDASRRAP